MFHPLHHRRKARTFSSRTAPIPDSSPALQPTDVPPKTLPNHKWSFRLITEAFRSADVTFFQQNGGGVKAGGSRRREALMPFSFCLNLRRTAGRKALPKPGQTRRVFDTARHCVKSVKFLPNQIRHLASQNDPALAPVWLQVIQRGFSLPSLVIESGPFFGLSDTLQTVLDHSHLDCLALPSPVLHREIKIAEERSIGHFFIRRHEKRLAHSPQQLRACGPAPTL